METWLGRYENNKSLLTEVMGAGTGESSLLIEGTERAKQVLIGKTGAMVH